MKIELVAMSQPIRGLPSNVPKNPVEISERCASVCYNSEPTKDFRIFKACLKDGHRSIAEHISFTFHVEGIDRALLAQLSRHRHISLSVVSQRYVSMDNFGNTTPRIANEEQMKKYNTSINTSKAIYKDLVDSGMAKEDARLVLPNSCYTEFYMTANARALIEMSHLRLCNRAQWEIREMFTRMKDEVARFAPEIAELMVPNCEVHKFCTEGKSCGKYKKLVNIIGDYQNKIDRLEKCLEELNPKSDDFDLFKE